MARLLPLRAAAAALLLLALARATAAHDASAFIVQLKRDPAAALHGSTSQSPSSGRRRFDSGAAHVQALAASMRQHADEVLAAANAAAAAAAPPARVHHYYTTAFAGFAAGPLSPRHLAALAGHPAVAAVFPNGRLDAQTVSVPAFLGLDTPGGLWSLLGGAGAAGEDVIIGVVDAGYSPQAPAFSDRTDLSFDTGPLAYGPPPATWAGICQPGEDFPASTCNNKVIGCRYFCAGLGGPEAVKQRWPNETISCGTNPNYLGTQHGSSVGSVAGGNVVPMMVGNASVQLSGAAPRARLAWYKVFWSDNGGGVSSIVDVVGGIDQAVADGVDVIVFTGGGPPPDSFTSPLSLSLNHAAASGVFVAASAGNAGSPRPYQVVNITPWVMTVGASSHSRTADANVVVTAAGGESTFAGAASALSSLPEAPIVLAEAVAAPGATTQAAQLCTPGALDAAKAAGKIVVCDRGLVARLFKGDAVMAAGGAGMVLVNYLALDSKDDIALDAYAVPTVHLAAADRLPLRALVAGGGASARFTAPVFRYNVPAPTMASFSSRGPIAGDPNVLKPDVVAPGVEILATTLPPQGYQYISGTSVSTPFVAGMAAMLMQLYPGWSPMAIKSALMTTAFQTACTGLTPDSQAVCTPGGGGPFGTPFDFGAGHINPSSAHSPGLVFDSGPADWLLFLCGVSLGTANPPPCDVCLSDPSLCDGANLNTPSVAVSVAGRITLARTLTSVLASGASFTADVAAPPGFSVTADPPAFSLAPNATQRVVIKVSAGAGASSSYADGAITWRSSAGTATRIPLVARAVAVAAPALIELAPPAPLSVNYTVQTAWAGSMVAVPVGLKAPRVANGSVAQDPNGAPPLDPSSPAGVVKIQQYINAGAGLVPWSYLRFALFAADVSPATTNLDLYVYDPLGRLLGSSNNAAGADEAVSVAHPATGTYTVYVRGRSVPAGGLATFRLCTWLLRPAGGGSPNFWVAAPSAARPAAAAPGGYAPVRLRFAPPSPQLSPTTRYLGAVLYGKREAGDKGFTTLHDYATLVTVFPK